MKPKNVKEVKSVKEPKKGKGVRPILPQKNTIAIFILAFVLLVLAVLIIMDRAQIAELKRKVEASGEAAISQDYKDKLRAEIMREINEGEQKYSELHEDLSKSNISELLKTPKTLGNLEIKDIELQTVDNVTKITANVVNNGDIADGDFMVTLNFKNEAGRSMMEVAAYINKVEPGKETPLVATTTTDFVNAYDFEVIK